MMGKKARAGNGDKNRTGREKKRKSSHGRESQVEMAEVSCGAVAWNWDRLWRGTVVG